jgi:hypothetical protein
MPRTGRFNDRDLSHVDALKLVASWLRAQKERRESNDRNLPTAEDGNWLESLVRRHSLRRLPQSSPQVTMGRKRWRRQSQPSPLDLAQSHLKRHGDIEHRQCKLCGAAWAIVHCEVALQEEMGHQLLEAFSAGRKNLEAPFSCLYTASARYVQSRLAGAFPKAGVAPPPKKASRKIPQKYVHLLFREVRIALRGMRGLARFMAKAESKLAARFVTPPLRENPGRRPRDYLRTAIDCYLFRHGWTVPEIFDLYYPGRRRTPLSCRSIYDAVERARKLGRPPLIGGWPESGKRAKRRPGGKKSRRASA